jgi:hypothetical protein
MSKGYGFHRDVANGDLEIVVNGTTVQSLTTTALTFTGTLTTSSSLTVTAGGATITAGGVTVTDGGIAVRGGARIREGLSITDVTTAGAGTYTAAALVGGIITRDCAGGARTDTTATATEIETELNAQGVAVATNDSFLCYVINRSDAAEAITIAGGTDVTTDAQNLGQTIAQNESAILLFTRTGANAYKLFVVGA